MQVRGVNVSERSQCAHYRSERDIVAIKFNCCGVFYACAFCHEELAGHPAQIWPKDQRDERAILCGNCEQTLSIDEYLKCDNACPNCEAAFNPRCAGHYHLYFECEKTDGTAPRL